MERRPCSSAGRTAALAFLVAVLSLPCAPVRAGAAAPAGLASDPVTSSQAGDSARAAADVAAARQVFEANLDAIRRRDRSAYLDCYLRSPTLARGGPQGFTLGYDSLAATR
ncbi:MAG TPA: hypothetical protein VI792_02420, partial [Candidatus Eisenbacteria bacterium]